MKKIIYTSKKVFNDKVLLANLICDKFLIRQEIKDLVVVQRTHSGDFLVKDAINTISNNTKLVINKNLYLVKIIADKEYLFKIHYIKKFESNGNSKLVICLRIL